MIILDYILYYLIAGLLFGLWIERMTISNGDTVNWKERALLIILWPIMFFIFIYHFIKGWDD